jgi:hypothetical protein
MPELVSFSEDPIKPRRLKHSDLLSLKLINLPHVRNDLRNMLLKRGHKTCGQGTFAVVIEHPEHSNLVIRISSRNDGWIGYALKNQGKLYAPRLDAIGYQCGLWVSVTERLTAITQMSFSDHRIKSAVNSMVMMHKRPKQGSHASEFSAHELEMHKGWDGLTDFLRQFFEVDNCDLKEANIMMRETVPVANDPISEMDQDVAREHEARWTIIDQGRIKT